MSNGSSAGASVPPVAAKVSDFQRIENRLSETIDMLRGVDQTATAVKGKLIGNEPSDESDKSPTPEPVAFVNRANRSLDIIHGILRGINTTLNDLNAQA